MERNIYDDIKNNEDIHWWFIGRRKIIESVLNKMLHKHAKNKVLEIGCGSGGNLQLLRTYGELHAMEYDDQARQIANSRNLCQVKFGELPDNIPFDDQFDLICLLDVLEHLDNDSHVLQSIAEKLNPGGTLLVTVPAYQFLWSEHDVANHHKRRYTRKSLQMAFKNTGVSIKYISYFNCALFPLILMHRLIGNIVNSKESRDITLPSPLINNLLKKVFASEQLFVPRLSLPFGVSVLAVAVKSPSADN